MEEKCYIHTKVKAETKCNRCYKPICTSCTNEYWKTNAISAMFSPQKPQNVKLLLCPKCLRIEKIKNILITSIFLILILGVIGSALFVYT